MIHAEYAILQIAHHAIPIRLVQQTITISREHVTDVQLAVLVAQTGIHAPHVTVVLPSHKTQLILLANAQMVTMV